MQNGHRVQVLISRHSTNCPQRPILNVGLSTVGLGKYPARSPGSPRSDP